MCKVWLCNFIVASCGQSLLNFPALLTLRMGISVARQHDHSNSKQVLNLQAGLRAAICCNFWGYLIPQKLPLSLLTLQPFISRLTALKIRLLRMENPAKNRPLAKVDFRPPTPPIPRGDPMPPPILGGECIQSPPELGDLGGIPGFMQEV